MDHSLGIYVLKAYKGDPVVNLSILLIYSIVMVNCSFYSPVIPVVERSLAGRCRESSDPVGQHQVTGSDDYKAGI